jgi:Rps23 Pro-64 3,4-dihydroxylase Tpa1-like proline 4-hydroxylase
MIALNPALDASQLAIDYALRKRLQIRDVLLPESARQIHGALLERTPWSLAFNDGPRVIELKPDQLARLTPDETQRIADGVQRGAQAGYQFLYNIHPLLAEYFRPGAPRTPLFDVFEFMNRPATLDFLRRVTGIPTIRWADGQATLYRAGHFLKYHTDETPSQRRAAAYVLNLTEGWGRDWGGYLQFFNDRYDIEEAYRPIFNALNLFTVPMDHSVGMVASYAPGLRLSITGWLREDEPPGPIRGWI